MKFPIFLFGLAVTGALSAASPTISPGALRVEIVESHLAGINRADPDVRKSIENMKLSFQTSSRSFGGEIIELANGKQFYLNTIKRLGMLEYRVDRPADIGPNDDGISSVFGRLYALACRHHQNLPLFCYQNGTLEGTIKNPIAGRTSVRFFIQNKQITAVEIASDDADLIAEARALKKASN